MPNNKKTQPTILITGGAKRIGKALCLALADQGFHIALHYNRSKSEAEKVADQINKSAGTCRLFACDLSDASQADQLIPDVLQHFPKLDILINNASIYKTSLIQSPDATALLKEHFAVNFEAPYVLTSRFAKACQKGHIINLLDTHIADNTTRHAAYLLSKMALYELTKLAAVELAPHIRVNGIAPGSILPPEKSRAGHLERLAKDIPLRKKGDVKQITQTIDFLLNTPYITGQVIFVDGGEHLV
jgi:NAD(P)-dependent dehydrogenase (short-subunit alcohol dehydrogenase family)